MKHGCCTDKACGPATCMELPVGLTCGACQHFPHCTRMYSVKRENTHCDFFPRRFRGIKAAVESKPAPDGSVVQEMASLRAIACARRLWAIKIGTAPFFDTDILPVARIIDEYLAQNAEGHGEGQ